MRTIIGMFLIIFGTMMGDSENLLIPSIVITIGAALIFIGKRRGEDADY